MFAHMKHIQTSNTQIRGYISPTPGLSIEMQRRMAADAQCKVVYEFGKPDTGGMLPRDRWMSSLRRGDIAWLPAVRCLVFPKNGRPEGYRPVPDMCRALNLMLATGVIIADARAGITSETPELWANHVYNEGRKISAGLRPEHVRLKAARAADAVRVPGLKTRWHAPAKRADLKRQKVIWTSALSDEEVLEYLDEELAGYSLKTLYGVLGHRRPNDPGAGGRGHKRKSR